VLGAAVIDDILGLLILAVVAGIVSAGTVQAGLVAIMAAKALIFLTATVVVGRLVAPTLGKWFSHIHSGIGMKMALALLVCAVFSYVASAWAGLAPIIGAFAAGLVLDPVHFERFIKPKIATRIHDWVEHINKHTESDSLQIVNEMKEVAIQEEDEHVENLIEGVGNFFIPIFFVYTGLHVNLAAFADWQTIVIALAITVVAVAGKAISGLAAGKGVSHALVGFGMVPRGEVGLIFINVGRQLGVINDQVFAIVVAVVILTTLLTPPILGAIVRKEHLAASS
jgi:Kef-type K+ transport system membrane component KefB